MFDVDAPACVTVGNPVVPVVGLVFNAKNNNSTVLMNWNVHELQRRTTLFIQSIFVYTTHKVNVVVVSTYGEYGLRYRVDFLCFTR